MAVASLFSNPPRETVLHPWSTLREGLDYESPLLLALRRTDPARFAVDHRKFFDDPGDPDRGAVVGRHHARCGRTRVPCISFRAGPACGNQLRVDNGSSTVGFRDMAVSADPGASRPAAADMCMTCITAVHSFSRRPTSAAIASMLVPGLINRRKWPVGSKT